MLFSPLGCSIYINYLEFFCVGYLFFCLSVYLFNHLFLSMWTQGYLFYTGVFIYIVAQIVLVLAIGSYFSQPPDPLAYLHH